MYKCITRNLISGQTKSVKIFEAFLLASKYDKPLTPFLRLENLACVKGLRICSARLCEKSDTVLPPEHDGSKSSENKSVMEENTNSKTANENPVLELDSKTDKGTTLMTDDGSTVQNHPMKNIHKQDASKPVKEVARGGKEGLLDLLGTMKVEVTSKRKLKNMKTKQEYVSASKPKAVPLESTISMFQNAKVMPSSQNEALSPELVAAASAAASTLPNPSQAESELLQQLRQHETISEAQKKGEGNNIGVIISEMKIGKNPNRLGARPANQIRFDDDGRGYSHERGITGELDSVRKRRNFFTSKRLNIFSPSEHTSDPTVARPTFWDMDFVNTLSMVTNQMSRNGFEEMIQWTKQGKMWQYPIVNETGLEEEANVPFHEHIFLEKHLKEGFPRHGPVRHFMELVIAGLSRNPHLSVQQKKDHIFWFRNYFCQKEDVLKEDDVYLS